MNGRTWIALAAATAAAAAVFAVCARFTDDLAQATALANEGSEMVDTR